MLRTCFSTAPSVTTSVRADGRVGPALGHQRQYVPFPWRQPVEWAPAAPGDELRDDFGVQDGTAAGHPAQRVEEVTDVGDPVLEQVPDPAPAVGEQVVGVRHLDVLGQHEHRGAGAATAARSPSSVCDGDAANL